MPSGLRLSSVNQSSTASFLVLAGAIHPLIGE
jgi:hypothetical protein